MASKAIRRLINRQSIGGWIMLILLVAWKTLDAWDTTEFLLSKIDLWTLLSAVASHISASRLQWALLIGGLLWLFIVAARAEHPKVLTVLPAPSKWTKAEIKQIAGELLDRAHDRGSRLTVRDDVTLIWEWAEKTRALIAKLYGEKEAQRFLEERDGKPLLEGQRWLHQRLALLQDLIARFGFTPIRDDFDPDSESVNDRQDA